MLIVQVEDFKIAHIIQLQFCAPPQSLSTLLCEKESLLEPGLACPFTWVLGTMAQILMCVLYGPSHLFSFVNQGFRKTKICVQRPQSQGGGEMNLFV